MSLEKPVNQTTVLHLINGEYHAGAERIQELFLRKQDLKRYHVLCISLLEGNFVHYLRSMCLPIETLPMKHKLDIWVVPELRRKLLHYDVKLLHTHTVRAHLIGRIAAIGTNTSVITHMHSHPLLESTSSLQLRINYHFERRTRRYSSHFICVSQELADRLMSEGVLEDQVSAVPNGIDVDRFSREPQAGNTIDRGKFRREIGVDDGTLAAMIALFRPIKGVETFLRALAQLAKQERDIHGVLIGDFEDRKYEQQMRELADRLHPNIGNRLQFLGRREDIAKILSEIDMLVYPSALSEGMPMTILEAMASGTPVIASCVGGIPEVVSDNTTGRLIKPNDPRSLAAAMSDLSDNPHAAQKMAEHARDMVRRHYSVDAMIHQVTEIYDSILNRENNNRRFDD